MRRLALRLEDALGLADLAQRLHELLLQPGEPDEEVAAGGDRDAERRFDLRPLGFRDGRHGRRQPRRHRGIEVAGLVELALDPQRRIARRRQQVRPRRAGGRETLSPGQQAQPVDHGLRELAAERVHLGAALDAAQALLERLLALLQLRELGARAVERRRDARDLGRQLGVLRGDAADRIVLLGEARARQRRRRGDRAEAGHDCESRGAHSAGGSQLGPARSSQQPSCSLRRAEPIFFAS